VIWNLSGSFEVFGVPKKLIGELRESQKWPRELSKSTQSFFRQHWPWFWCFKLKGVQNWLRVLLGSSTVNWMAWGGSKIALGALKDILEPYKVWKSSKLTLGGLQILRSSINSEFWLHDESCHCKIVLDCSLIDNLVKLTYFHPKRDLQCFDL
jgi:hypothetical protein